MALFNIPEWNVDNTSHTLNAELFGNVSKQKLINKKKKQVKRKKKLNISNNNEEDHTKLYKSKSRKRNKVGDVNFLEKQSRKRKGNDVYENTPLKKFKIDNSDAKTTPKNKRRKNKMKKNKLIVKNNEFINDNTNNEDSKTNNNVTELNEAGVHFSVHEQKGTQCIQQENCNISVQDTEETQYKKHERSNKSLRTRMIEKLKASRFRYLNEQMYTNSSKEVKEHFIQDKDSYLAYHEGYKQQVSRWPLNPVDKVIKSLKRKPEHFVIADFGCGDAKLARSLTNHKVHSFDLISLNRDVVACDMAHTPLPSESVDVVVFCLSLMGTNLLDYLLEANRVLKTGGLMKIVEVESRFSNVGIFIEDLKKFGFKNIGSDLSHQLFYFLDFRKVSSPVQKNKLPSVSLKPCLYKKR